MSSRGSKIINRDKGSGYALRIVFRRGGGGRREAVSNLVLASIYG